MRRGVPTGLLLLLALLALAALLTPVAAGPRVHIPDDLDDVTDNEEDEDFALWGRPKVKEDADEASLTLRHSNSRLSQHQHFLLAGWGEFP